MIDHIVAAIAIAILVLIALRILSQQGTDLPTSDIATSDIVNTSDILNILLGALKTTAPALPSPPPVALPYPPPPTATPYPGGPVVAGTVGSGIPGAPPPPAGSSPMVASSERVDNAGYEERRTVDLMFATTRKYDGVQERFTGERSTKTTLGQARVRVPEVHRPGELERPRTYSLFSFALYKQNEDRTQHFVVSDISILTQERWLEMIDAIPSDEALVFVHGFNTSFEDALYRNAQVVWDLKFKGIAVLFSWPSRGAVIDYVYDQNSAAAARKPFIKVLELLASRENIKQIHVLAHSMGNQVVLDALANHPPGGTPLKLGQLIMAAPDVDRNLYESIAPDARKFTSGMTLYASAADKALAASRILAGRDVPRAGDVPSDGPIVLDDIDSFDATSLGEEILGLNHGTFSKSLSILNDVHLLLLSGRRPPRVLEVEAVPEGADPPKYWRYIGTRR
jgi:esterase/lipase superfamily enzyme